MSELKQKLTLSGLTMIAVGSCIGAGIFVTPYQIVQALPHQGWVLVVWILGGLIALTGALTFAELGARFPQAGGVYVFLKEAYGDWVGFIYGWVILLVINTGALAALGLALAEYMTYFVGLGEQEKLLLAIVIIAGLTGINILGVQTSQVLAKLFTGLKLVAMVVIVGIGIFYFDAEKVPMAFALNENLPENIGSALLVALIGVLWSFGGWHHASYLAAETIDAKRTVPRAMILGATIVTIIYVLINLAYMLLLPLDAIAGTTKVAGEAVGSVFAFGGKFVAIVIAISIFGTISIYTMSAPRIYYAMARDGIFFEMLSRVHPRFRTPANAMLLQAAWAIVLLLFWGTFHDLITYVTFMDIALMALAGASIFVFRAREDLGEAPFKTPFFPVIPLIFIGISTAFVINTLIERPVQAIAGLVFFAIGLGVYFLFKQK